MGHYNLLKASVCIYCSLTEQGDCKMVYPVKQIFREGG